MRTYGSRAAYPARASAYFAAVGILSIFAASAEAQTTLSYWDFNNVSASAYPTTSTAMRNALFAATGGVKASTATMSTDFVVSDGVATPGSTATSTVAGVTFQTGTTVGEIAGDTSGAGQALQMQAGSSPTSAIVNNGNYLQFGASTTSYSNISVIFALDDFYAPGFNSDQFEYSTDGTTWTAFGAPIVPVTAFADAGSLQTIDLSSVSGLNNDANAQFRIVFNGATGIAGADKIDNLQIDGTSSMPEPSVLSLLLTPAALAGVRFLRRRK